ncbi:unnamed protein product, partial [Medioppia subpectinata]
MAKQEKLDLSHTWTTDSFPEFALCFEETALVWMPSLILFVTSLYEWHNRSPEVITSRASSHPTTWTLLSITKIIYTIVLTINYKKRGMNTSGVLFIFWLCLSIGTAVNFKTVLSIAFSETPIESSINVFTFTTKSLSFPIIITQLLFSCFADSTQVFTTVADRENSSPENQSSFLSRLTFSWFTPMIMNGYRKPLTTEDMWSLSTQNRTNVFIKQFNKHWKPIQNNKTKNAINIFPVVLKTFWSTILFNACIQLVSTLLTFTQPLILDRLITFMTPVTDTTTATVEPIWRGYLYAGAMFVSPVLASVLNGQYDRRQDLLLMKIRSSCLRLSSAGRKDFATGDIVNLISADMIYLTSFFYFLNNLWLGPAVVAISTWLLWAQLGAATLVGVSVLVLLIPFNSFMITREHRLWAKILAFKDKRVAAITETINHIKVLKLYGWEPAFMTRVFGHRAQECAALSSVMVIGVISTAIVSATPYLCRVSVKRMNAYLNANEVNESFVDHKPNQRTPIVVKN